jgi:hypothetical protein
MNASAMTAMRAVAVMVTATAVATMATMVVVEAVKTMAATSTVGGTDNNQLKSGTSSHLGNLESRVNSLSAMDGHARPLKNSFVTLRFLAKFLSVHKV